MEPTFTEVSGETVTAKVTAQLAVATAALPLAHRLNPDENESFESKEAAFLRLQNWAFTKGFAIVKESAKTKVGQVVRLYLECVHHKKETRNTRKLSEGDRKRLQTRTQTNNCKFSIVVSYQEKNSCWTVRGKNLEHSHAPNPDPFQYHQHRDKIPGRETVISMASTHRTVISYRELMAIVGNAGLPKLSKTEFWNLQRKEGNEAR